MKYIKLYILLAAFFSAGCLSSGDYDGERFFTVVAAGDTVHPVNEGHVDEFIALGKEIYAPTRDIISSGDLSFVNVEGPFMENRKGLEQGNIVFAGYTGDLDNMLWAGFNCFSLANNHALDCGAAGVKSTLDLFGKKKSEPEHRNIIFAGLGLTPGDAEKFSAAVINNVQVAFFAYSARYNREGNLCNSFSPDKVVADLRSAEGAQLKIVSVHHGDEFVHVPPADVVRDYHALIDAGADLVLGHHPHVVQGIEKYGRGIIFYSLGNYAMGTVSKRHMRRNGKLYSFITRVRFRKTGQSLRPESVEVFPLYSDNANELVVNGKVLKRRRFVPEVLTGDFADHVLDRIESWSAQVPGNKTVFAREGDVLTVKF
ncbi:MAG TPA: CapA family protein [Spirochaetota bacterium]|nr:CapA family protein [Spirochaetota bacterium]